MDELGVTHCDAIVSGLPWASFPEELQDDILDAVLDVLKPGGTFATFAYLRGDKTELGQQFRRKLNDRFSDIELSRTVWKNIPPAFVYRARSPE